MSAEPEPAPAPDRPPPPAVAPATPHGPSRARRVLSTLAFVAVLAALVLYGVGAFRTHSEHAVPAAPDSLPAPAQTALATRATLPVIEEAVGTIRSRRTVEVAAQVTARVVKVLAETGQTVRQGEPLAELDGRELAARLSQAKQVLSAAESAIASAKQGTAQAAARLEQSRLAVERARKLAAERAATTEALEAAESAHLQASAALADAEARTASAAASREQAASAVREAEIAAGHATIVAPLDGVVGERRIETGDLALVGRTLFVVFDPAALRLEARVREGLIGRVREGDELLVQVPAAGAAFPGRVSVVLPAASAASRTFEVRVDLEARPELRVGMFGRLRVPAGEREVVSVPRRAIVRVGQLETVVVRDGERWRRRLVTTGTAPGSDALEVLSGLVGGETVGLAP